jgi:Holliday junction resolvasome RuvABC endonuclease subunit
VSRPLCWIGIDPSYSATAIVRLHSDDTYHAQTVSFSPKTTGNGAQRLDAIWRILAEKFETLYTFYDVRAVALEGYAMESKFGREMAGELGGLLRVLSMRELHRSPLIVAPSSLKKFVTGAGRADKDAMKAAVAEKWGAVFKSHDEADAYGLARIAKASQRGTVVDYEKEVLKTVMQRTAK